MLCYFQKRIMDKRFGTSPELLTFGPFLTLIAVWQIWLAGEVAAVIGDKITLVLFENVMNIHSDTFYSRNRESHLINISASHPLKLQRKL